MDFSNDPMRPPAWRWHAAGSLLADHNRRAFEHEDGWVRIAAEHRHGRDKQSAAVPTSDTFQVVAVARQLWEHPTLLWDRTLIEAHLLMGQTATEVADRLSLDPGVVDAYGSIFFDVHPRLGQRTYILHRAIGHHALTGLPQTDLAIVLKLYAFMGGEHVLNTVVSVFRPVIRTQLCKIPELVAPVDQLNMLRVLLAVGGHMELFTPVELTRLTERLAELEHQFHPLTGGAVAALPILPTQSISPVMAPDDANCEGQQGPLSPEKCARDAQLLTYFGESDTVLVQLEPPEGTEAA